MNLCTPTIVGPVSELNRKLRVQGVIDSATVIVSAQGPNPRVVAKAQPGISDAVIDLLPGEQLSHDDLLVAEQHAGTDASPATATALATAVQRAPQLASEIGFVGYETHLYECGEALWLSGATPGAVVQVDFGGVVRGSGEAFDGNARFTLNTGLSRGAPANARQVVPGLPAGPTTTRSPDGLPATIGVLLPPPAIYEPLKACQTAVSIGSVFDGATVTLQRTGGPSPEVAIFDRSGLWFNLQKPLVDGEKITASQSLPKCERRGQESQAALVNPAVPIEIPTIDGGLCAGATRVPVLGLIPGAKVQIMVGAKVYLGQTPREVTSYPFDLGEPLPATPGTTVSVRQERCGVFGVASPAVPIDPHETVTTQPKILGPLLGCGRYVFVGEIHPNSVLQVFSKLKGNTPISNQVVINATTGAIAVAPYLAVGDDVTVAQWACGGARLDSFSEHVKAAAPLVAPKVSGLSGPVVSGDTAVRIDGAVPGATVEVFSETQEQLTFIGLGVAAPAPMETIVYLSRTLKTGDRVRAQQFLCNVQSSATNPAVLVVVPPPLTPVLTAPVNHATNVNRPPVLSWSDPGATQERKAMSYLLEIREGATGILPPTTLGNVTSQQVGPTLGEGKKYTWILRAVNSTGQSPAASADFTTVPPAPPPPPPSTTPTISVTKSSGSFHVTGSGFLHNHAVHLRVVNDGTLQSNFYQATSTSSGTLDTTPAIPSLPSGTVLDFSANDERPVPTSVDITGTLWSNTFKVTV